MKLLFGVLILWVIIFILCIFRIGSENTIERVKKENIKTKEDTGLGIHVGDGNLGDIIFGASLD
jgi:hypothetical protein